MNYQQYDNTNTQQLQKLVKVEKDSLMSEIPIIVKNPVEIRDSTPFYSDWSFYLFFASILIAIFALFIPNVLEKKFRRKREENRLNELKEYYFNLLKSYVDPLHDLILAITDVSEAIKNKEYGDIQMRSIRGLNFEQIISIDDKDMYKILILNIEKDRELKYSHFKNLMNCFQDIQATKKSIKEQVSEYGTRGNIFVKRWNDNINEIGRFYDSEITRIKMDNIDPFKDKLFHEMYMIDAKWQKLGDSRNMFIAVENFIDPLNKLCEKYPTDARTLVIIPKIVGCLRAFTDFKNIKDFHSSILNALENDVKEDLQSIEDAINFYEA